MDNQIIHRWCKRVGLTDEGGNDLVIMPARLRKTYKFLQTKQTQGQLADLTGDHSPNVHLNHYARMAALVPVHRQIVHEALTSTRDVMTRTTVLTDDDLKIAEVNPEVLATKIQRPLPVLQQALSGELDLWMVSCTGFLQSPFAPPGQPCSGSPLGWCMDCENGLVTPNKLPAIYAFLNRLIEQRQRITPENWSAAFGGLYRKIVFGILAKYPDNVLREARIRAESEVDLAYLGPALRPWGDI